MVTIYDVPANDLISGVKEELKSSEAMKTPDWALFVKSGASREKPPQQADFWQIRAAALLRKIAIKGPIGVSRLTNEYGGKKNRGSKPEHPMKASGKIIRTLLQQLETAGYVKKNKKGRALTPAGQKFLDSVAYKVSKAPEAKEMKTAPKKEIVAEEKPAEEEKKAPEAKKE